MPPVEQLTLGTCNRGIARGPPGGRKSERIN